MAFPILATQVETWMALSFGALSAALAVAVWRVRRRFQTQGEQLRLEKERWDLLLEANQDGIFDVDFHTGAAFFSPQWLGQLGYTNATWTPTAESWKERIHPEDRARVETRLAQYLARGVSAYDIEYRLRHRNGEWCWTHARAHAVWNRKGEAIRLVGSHADITKRKQAECELKASEARLRTFLDNNPARTFIKDESGHLLYANKAMVDIHPNGSDLVGKLDSERWPQDVAAELHANDQAVFASGMTQEFLERVVLADGSVRENLTKKFLFQDASGRWLLGGIALDVTERRKTEEALQRSEERYRELFERTPLPAWVYDRRTFRIQDVNAAAIAHYGWSRDEFLKMKVTDIRMPDEAKELEADLESVVARNGVSGPWRHRRKGGSTIWVVKAGQDLHSNATPLRLTLVHDITDQVEAEKNIKLAYERLEALVEQRTAELRESEMKWRALVEATPQIVFATGPDGEPEYVSPHGVEYTGLGLEGLQRGRWLNAVHPNDQNRIASAWQAAVESGEDYDVEFRFRSRSGDYRWFKALARPIRDAEGKVTRWIGTDTDIDDQKRSEAALEAAVERRTLELAEARDRAEAATRAKSQFLAAMSHEIRTPMNGVIGMASVMLDTELTSQQRCYMDTIRSSGQALLTVINDILDLSKIEAGRLELECVQFDLSTLIEEAIEVVAAQAGQKNVRLDFHLDESIPLDLLGDPVRLRQIVLNLLGNAVKFTEYGSVSLSVTREATQNNMAVLRFAVRDTGIGLTQKQQESLFEAFQQADMSTTRRFGGTGLGLAIAKRLVEIMGGSIGVASQVGEGSTFWFNLCLEAASVDTSLHSFRGKHVALVTNQEETSAMITSHLEANGLSVTTYMRVPQPTHTHFHLLLVDSAAIPHPSDAVQLWSFDQVPVLVLGAAADFRSLPMPEQKEVYFVPKPVRRLPLLRAVASAFRGTLPQTQSASGTGLSVGFEARVLLAEDNKVNQLVAKAMLDKLGCAVDIAENGLEACNAIQKQLYDVVLMDCHMPVMNGFEATERIRALETSGRRTPVIALTAGVLKEERDRCYAAGMDDFLSKPISREDLETALGKWISVHAEPTL